MEGMFRTDEEGERLREQQRADDECDRTQTADGSLQFALFWACLTAAGAHLGIGAVIAAFALSRLLTTAPITPGGAGVSESGTAALLIALGAQPASTAAALLLFAFFSYAMEIPVGGLAWLTWAMAKQWRIPPPVARDDRKPGTAHA